MEIHLPTQVPIWNFRYYRTQDLSRYMQEVGILPQERPCNFNNSMQVQVSGLLIHTFDLKPYGEVIVTSLDEIVTYNINLTSAIKLRIIGGAKFTYLYRVDIAANEASGLNDIKSSSFKLAGRKLITSQPVNISLYNSVGALVFEKDVQNEIELPISLGKGIFFIKSNQGSQKIVLN